MSAISSREFTVRSEFLKRENRKQSLFPARVPPDQWPEMPSSVVEVWRSAQFLITVYREPSAILRISVCRTSIDRNGDWLEGISWDDLMAIKTHIGMGEKYAIEVYPRDSDTVNVANMRHLWVLPEPLAIGWFKK